MFGTNGIISQKKTKFFLGTWIIMKYTALHIKSGTGKATWIAGQEYDYFNSIFVIFYKGI